MSLVQYSHSSYNANVRIKLKKKLQNSNKFKKIHKHLFKLIYAIYEENEVLITCYLLCKRSGEVSAESFASKFRNSKT